MQITYNIDMGAMMRDIQNNWKSLESENPGFDKHEQFKVGMIVQHSGYSSGLYQNIGVVTYACSGWIEVTWLIDRYGKWVVDNVKDLALRRVSKYTSNWVFENLDAVMGVEVTFENMQPQTMNEAHMILDEDYKSGTYILWGPDGSSNPTERHKSRAEADKAALSMSKRRKATFYVCKLEGKATHKVTVTSSLEQV